MPITRDDHYYDHQRDLRKHEPRPGEKDYVPLHAQSAPIMGALEVAILAQALPLTKAAELIDQYARTIASEARLQAVIETSDRIVDTIEKIGGRVDA